MLNIYTTHKSSYSKYSNYTFPTRPLIVIILPLPVEHQGRLENTPGLSELLLRVDVSLDHIELIEAPILVKQNTAALLLLQLQLC